MQQGVDLGSPPEADLPEDTLWVRLKAIMEDTLVVAQMVLLTRSAYILQMGK